MYLSKEQIENILNGSLPIPVTTVATKSGFLNLTTSAAGTKYVTFANTDATTLIISNQTDTTIEVRQDVAEEDEAEATFLIPTAQIVTLSGIINANQISLRRSDTSDTQVTVGARWEK